MGLLPSIISVIFSMGFLVLLFLFAWYIALPLVLIMLVIGLFNFFSGRPFLYRMDKFTNIMSDYRRRNRKQADSSRPRDEKIIDVEYTELP